VDIFLFVHSAREKQAAEGDGRDNAKQCKDHPNCARRLPVLVKGTRKHQEPNQSEYSVHHSSNLQFNLEKAGSKQFHRLEIHKNRRFLESHPRKRMTKMGDLCRNALMLTPYEWKTQATSPLRT
jgi:hypothetical protein